MVPTITEAMEVWEPHFQRIAQMHVDAWAEWKAVRRFRLENGFGPILYKREITNYIFGAIARNAIPEFGSIDDVNVLAGSQTFKIHHRGQLLRFKKGNLNSLGMNIPTQSVLDFIQADAELSGMPPETAKLEVTWRGNELFTELESVHIVARDGNKLVWKIPVDLNVNASLVLLPTRVADEPEDDIRALVRPKPKKNTEVGKD